MGKTQQWLCSFAVRHGRTKTVLLVTALSTALSALVMGLIAFSLGGIDAIPTAGWVAAVLAPLLIVPPVSAYLVGLVIEIDRLEAEMRALAAYDGLTGAHNRRTFLSGAQMLGRLAIRLKQRLAVLMLDLDDLKRINDTYGHAVGDEVLKSLVNAMRNCARSSDLVGRVGGGEFAVCLPDTRLEDAMQMAERLLADIRAAAVTVAGNPVRFTASIGVAVSDPADEEMQSVEQLLWLADAALYAAKRDGRDCARTAGDVGLPPPAP